MPHTKKCNPLLIVGLVILLVFLGLVAFVGYHAVDAAKASPNLAIDYIEELRDLSRSHQPLSGTQPNRYHEVQGLLDLVRSTIENLPEGSDPNFSLLYTDYEPEEPAIENPFFDEPTHEELVARASLALDALENEGVFEKLAEWPQIRHAVNDTWPSGHKMRSPLFVSIDFMNVGEYRRLSRALIAHAHIKMEAGDSDAAIDDFEQSLAVARIATCEPFLLSTLVGIACDAITCNAIRGDITEHRLSAKQIGERPGAAENLRPSLTIQTHTAFDRDTECGTKADKITDCAWVDVGRVVPAAGAGWGNRHAAMDQQMQPIAPVAKIRDRDDRHAADAQ